MYLNYDMKRRNCSIRGTSPFFHCVFKLLVLRTGKNKGLFEKGLNTLDGVSLTDSYDRTAVRVKPDQAACMCKLILLYTL